MSDFKQSSIALAAEIIGPGDWSSDAARIEAALVAAFNAGVERGAHWLAAAPCTQEDEDAYVASGKGGPFDFYAEQVRALKLPGTT